VEGAHIVREVQLVKDSQKSDSSLLTCVCVCVYSLFTRICVNTYEGGTFRCGSGAGQIFSKSTSSLFTCICVNTYEEGTCRRGSGAC